MNTSSLIQKVWNFCHTLHDDGVGYGDYLEQLTYLLFLKMAHEYAQEPYLRDTHIPKGHGWPHLKTKLGEPLEAQYLATLHKLGQEPGMLGAIFFKAQNKIQDPAKLSRLVQLIDAESWVGMDADTKGDLYEGLLQKNAEDTKSGAGQYFTPRALIQAGTTSLSSLMWMVGFVTFFLSAILDNLTTTIVMVSLMKLLLDRREGRLFFADIIIIAANAGGA